MHRSLENCLFPTTTDSGQTARKLEGKFSSLHYRPKLAVISSLSKQKQSIMHVICPSQVEEEKCRPDADWPISHMHESALLNYAFTNGKRPDPTGVAKLAENEYLLTNTRHWGGDESKSVFTETCVNPSWAFQSFQNARVWVNRRYGESPFGRSSG